MQVMAFHSYRGGTGKTLLSTNIAAVYARKEKVCIVDYDLRAPSLHSFFKVKEPDWWINDFLNGNCEIDECLIEVLPNLFIGPANPEAEAIRELMDKDRAWESQALTKTLQLRDLLSNQGFSKLIFDTSPGIAFSSINAVVGSDLVSLVMRMDSLDILGTKEMIKGVYELLERPTYMVVNMVLPQQTEIYEPVLKRTFGQQNYAYLPCLCEIRDLIAQGKNILIDEEMEYAEDLKKLAYNLEQRVK